MRLILASASPSRLRLLRAAGIDPEVVVSAVDEDQMLEQMPDASPQEVAVVLAQAKARDVAVRHPGWLVTGGGFGAGRGRSQSGKAAHRAGRRCALAEAAWQVGGADHRPLPDPPRRRNGLRRPAPGCTSRNRTMPRSMRTWRPVSRCTWPAASPSMDTVRRSSRG